MENWKVKNKELNQKNLVEQIYLQRGINNYIELFNLGVSDLHDPFKMHDMQKVVDRLKKAIDLEEKILVYGDYDVDGITATYIMYKTLQDLGALVYYQIPSRFDNGYGLSEEKALEIINDDFEVVITVDNGIKSHLEADLFLKNQVDLIITDHHEREVNLPKAFAIVHTELSDYPFKPLAGVGVAFKLSQALIGEKALELVDIASLGTIADMMPLIDENRAIVNLGLSKLAKTKNIGLKKLIQFLNLTLPSISDVQFKIAPRLNACGRMESAHLAVELLLSESEREANQILKKIEDLNNTRKKITSYLHELSNSKIDKTSHANIVSSKEMHEGIIGIVASKIANQTNKVTVVLKETKTTFKGSIRSYQNFDLIEALKKLSPYLIKFGGHQNAAGLEMKKENYEAFKKGFLDLVPKNFTKKDMHAEGYIDIYNLDIQEIINLDQYDLKDSLFIFENCEIKNRYLLSDSHSKIVLSNNIEAIAFNNKKLFFDTALASKITFLGRLDVNFYRNFPKKIILIDDYFIIESK